MRVMYRYFIFLSMFFLLGGCGFHLRGLGTDAKPLPFRTVYLEGSPNMVAHTATVFRRDDRIQIVTDSASADAVLRMTSDRIQKDISVINRGGNVNEYLLVLTAQAQLFKNGVSYSAPFAVTVRRTYTYSDNQILGKQSEESELRVDMYREAAEQILRRLPYLEPSPVQPVAGVVPNAPKK